LTYDANMKNIYVVFILLLTWKFGPDWEGCRFWYWVPGIWIDWYDHHVVLLRCVTAVLMLKVRGAGNEGGTQDFITGWLIRKIYYLVWNIFPPQWPGLIQIPTGAEVLMSLLRQEINRHSYSRLKENRHRICLLTVSLQNGLPSLLFRIHGLWVCLALKQPFTGRFI
jgi:hypothetical protein